MSAYPEYHMIPKDSQELWHVEDTASMIATSFETLAQQKNITLNFSHHTLTQRIQHVLYKVHLEQLLLFVLPKDMNFNWLHVKHLLSNQYPQINITRVSVWEIEKYHVYGYLYIPVAVNFDDLTTNDLPFTFGLEEALIQEDIIAEEDSFINGWMDQLFLFMLTEDILPTYVTYQMIDDLLLKQVLYNDELEDNSMMTDTDILSLSLDVLEERLEQLESEVDEFHWLDVDEPLSRSVSVDSIKDQEDVEDAYNGLNDHLLIDELENTFEFPEKSDSDSLINTPEVDELMTESNHQEIQDSLEKIQELLDKEAELEFKRQRKQKKEKLEELSHIPSHVKDSQEKKHLSDETLYPEQIEYFEKHELATYTKDDLIHRVLYLQESLKRASDGKSRLEITNERLEYQNKQLERQLMNYQIQRFEETPVHQQRAKDWHKKIKIPIAEYDELIQKAKLLEHIWKINQQLIGTSEKMIIQDKDKIYAFEKVQQIKNSARDLELFVMMDECKNIQERVKIKKKFLFLPARVIIQKRDYENLLEKATYYDMMHVENQVLERLLESSYDNGPKKKKKVNKQVSSSKE